MGLDDKNKSTSNYCLKDKQSLVFDTRSKVEIFKDFFTGLADGLLKKLPKPSNRFGIDSVISYYRSRNIGDNIFTFNSVSEDEVLKLLNNTNVHKASGLDKISGIFLRDGADFLYKPITKLCNLSITLKTFPDVCKIAKLKPLFKKGSRTEPKNYRPISLLPLLSKIFERTIHNQTQAFLDRNHILYDFQSGFRTNCSTDFCLSYLNDKISKGFDSGLLTGMILIDLQKAFDTINHTILLDKMQAIGFSDEVVLWFKSYLSNRLFQVLY